MPTVALDGLGNHTNYKNILGNLARGIGRDICSILTRGCFVRPLMLLDLGQSVLQPTFVLCGLRFGQVVPVRCMSQVYLQLIFHAVMEAAATARIACEWARVVHFEQMLKCPTNPFNSVFGDFFHQISCKTIAWKILHTLSKDSVLVFAGVFV